MIQAGAEHTTSEAAHLPVSEVFSCPKFKVLDVGRAYPQGWPHRFGGVFKPHVHPVGLNSQRMVSEFPEGIKTMSTTTPEKGTIPRFTSTSTAHPERVAIPQPIPLLPKSEYGTPEHIASVEKHFGTEATQQVIARQQAIENHLSTALWHVRHGTGDQSIQAATGRAIRAASMLKQACEASQIGGAQ